MAVDTSSITTGLDSARAKIAGTIKNAASATGASFEYLISAAKIESNLNPSAQASTSSARGLYQFIEQTWLGTVKEAGSAFGFGKYADAITKSDSGRYSVADSATRDEILKLRDDPAANAAMAGVLTQSNSFKLTGMIGRRPTDGELYMAHFMGVSGASRLISSAEDNPHASGPAMFPSAAAANRSIFYNRDGSARSVSQVYSVLTSRYDAAANSPTARTAMAAAGVTPGSRMAAAPVDNAAYLSSFPQVRAPAEAPAQVAALQTPAQPVFRSLYQTGDRPEPVSNTVRELWGNNTSITNPLPAGAATRTEAPQGLGLFSDSTGVFSGQASRQLFRGRSRQATRRRLTQLRRSHRRICTLIYAFILIVGLIAGILGGIVGTGTSIMLLPVLAYSFGPKQAVPIMAIAAIMANIARILAWWRDIDWRAVVVYALPGIPAAALGAGTLLALPSGFVDIAIGAFFILMIPFRRWMHARQFTLPLWSLAIIGAAMGYLTGIVASTGPMTVPIFVSYGLIRGPLLGTEAAVSLAVYISKAITFQRLDALPPDIIFKGLIAGSSLFVGAFIAKRVVMHINAANFHHLMEALMLVAGLSMFWSAFQG